MRIGIFLDEWRDGGVPVFLNRLEQFLTREGHEVFLFLAHPYPKRDEVSKNLYLQLKARLGLRCISLDCNSFPVPWREAHIRQAILGSRLSCLLINHFEGYIENMRALAEHVPLISVAHTDLDYYYLEFLRTQDFTRAHIVVSERIREKTLLLTPPDQVGRIHHIPYGVEPVAELFQPQPQGLFRVVYCARLDPSQKRCQNLVPIWKSFLAAGGQGQLVIIGTGRSSDFLRSEFQRELEGGSVKMPGQISTSAVLAEMAEADVILNLSNYEGLPQVVLEGASLGLHPLLSDIESGHREIVAKLKAGTLCHVGDTAAFAGELLRLKNSLPEIRQQRKQIRHAVLDQFPLDRACQAYVRVMREAGLKEPQAIIVNPPLKTVRLRFKRACLLVKYRRHFGVF